MKRTLSTALLLTAFFAASQAYAQAGTRIPLRNAREAVAAAYASLNQPGVDQRDLYGSLTPDMQADVWLLQIETFLAANPPLTSEQRSVTMETIGVLSSGAMERYASKDPDIAARARAEFESIATRGAVAFSSPGKLAFNALGHAAVDTAVATLLDESVNGMRPHTPKEPRRNGDVASNNEFECNCNSYYDSCGYAPCKFVPMACVRKPAGCGWNWAQACNGWCNV